MLQLSLQAEVGWHPGHRTWESRVTRSRIGDRIEAGLAAWLVAGGHGGSGRVSGEALLVVTPVVLLLALLVLLVLLVALERMRRQRLLLCSATATLAVLLRW